MRRWTCRLLAGHYDHYDHPVWTQAVAGSVIGVGEVLLLPLDVLKIKSQTNPEVLRGRGLLRLLREEKLTSLYRGWIWTAARNGPGSFCLFGGNAFVKSRVFSLDQFEEATLWQHFVASAVGGIASVVVSSPMDVIKTRVQNRSFDSTETGSQVVRQLLQKEGFSALFKGLIPKVFVVAPKVIFSFTVAQSLTSYFGHISSR